MLKKCLIIIELSILLLLTGRIVLKATYLFPLHKFFKQIKIVGVGNTGIRSSLTFQDQHFCSIAHLMRVLSHVSHVRFVSERDMQQRQK